MFETIALIAILLLVAGVVGSVVPMVPSGLLSLAGVFTYAIWGPMDMGVLLLVSFTVVGFAAAVLEHFAGPITARASGASNRTVIYAAGAGILLFFLTGPIGILIGMFGAIFILEVRRGATLEDAVRRAAYTVAGILGSTVIQVILTVSILIGFLLFLLVFGS